MSPTHSDDTRSLIAGRIRQARQEGSSCSLTVGELSAFLRQVLVHGGAGDETASVLAENCAHAERDGAHSHGVYRMPGYLSTLGTRWVDGHAVPQVADISPSIVAVDARNGFAQPALKAALPLLISKARATGIVQVLIKDSHHFGALSLDVEPLASLGFVALTSVNGTSHMAAHGGARPVYGTNPMAFAVPRLRGNPIVFDQASSVMARGDVQLAAEAGTQVPPGVGNDRHGRPTTDPRAILDGGMLLPFGGHKGSSIAMMVEILAAAMTGGNFSHEVDKSMFPGAHTSRTGQFLLCMDPCRAAGEGFAGRVEALAEKLLESGQSRLPGDRRYAQRAISERTGIKLDPDILLALQDTLR